jgi:hypothetical protein
VPHVCAGVAGALHGLKKMGRSPFLWSVVIMDIHETWIYLTKSAWPGQIPATNAHEAIGYYTHGDPRAQPMLTGLFRPSSAWPKKPIHHAVAERWLLYR